MYVIYWIQKEDCEVSWMYVLDGFINDCFRDNEKLIKIKRC